MAQPARTPGTWATLLASERQRASTAIETPSSKTVALALKPTPTAEFLPAIRRSLAELTPQLATRLGRLLESQEPWPLFLHGPAGTGKTCAALATGDCVAGPVIYTTAVGFSADLNARRFDAATTWRHTHGLQLVGRYDAPPDVKEVWRQLEAAQLVIHD